MERESPAVQWCFTLNNYTEEEESVVKGVFENECKYGIYGREVGASGTKHLQGYCVFTRKLRCNQVRVKLGGRAHVEKTRGSPRQASDYCKKEGDYVEVGELPSAAGKRKTRDELATEFGESVRGGRIEEFALANPGVWAWDGGRLMRNYCFGVKPVERPGISVKWIWGPPGVGKSRMAHETLKDAYIKDPRTKWWNGYMLEKTVIIDDFGPNGIDINHLLRWFDRYKCLVEVKGDMVALLADTFIVTSNFHPRDVFKDERTGIEHSQLPALMRRITVIHMGEFTVRGAN